MLIACASLREKERVRARESESERERGGVLCSGVKVAALLDFEALLLVGRRLRLCALCFAQLLELTRLHMCVCALVCVCVCV